MRARTRVRFRIASSPSLGAAGAAALFLITWANAAHADVRLPAVLGSHMVLQQKADVKIWGWADPGEEVSVSATWSADGKTSDAATPARASKSVKAGADGHWSVTLNTPAAGGPYEIKIAGKNSITLDDVLIGEVWLCSGQSNMEWPVGKVGGTPGIENFEKEIAAANFPEIRLFKVEHARADAPADDVKGAWRVCTPASIPDFSAVAYFFGRKLRQELNVPVGLLQSTWGGTEVELWMSEPALRGIPDYAAAIERIPADRERYEREFAEWKTRFEAADAGWGKWHAAQWDDADWTKAEKVGVWDNDLASFDGVVWYRAMLEVPAEWAGQTAQLDLGIIDDDDVTWINGKQIGTTTGATKPRKYDVPADVLTSGANTLVVRIRDRIGAGGFRFGPDQPCLRRGEQRAAPKEWRWKVGVNQKDAPIEPTLARHEHSTLYNAMIAPLTPLTIRGFTWYQGESNVRNALQYRTAFGEMILDWRRAFAASASADGGPLPFYFVQIAPFDYAPLLRGAPLEPGCATAELREAQLLTLWMPNTGMVVTTDIAPDVKNIHPPNKQDVGARLALWALARTYAKRGVAYSGPLIESARVADDGIYIQFAHVGSGLTTRGGDVTGVEVAGEDQKFFAGKAVIVGDELRVFAPDGRKIVAARCGWSDTPEFNLMNKDGFPASPFRTDHWPMATEKVKW